MFISDAKWDYISPAFTTQEKVAIFEAIYSEIDYPPCGVQVAIERLEQPLRRKLTLLVDGKPPSYPTVS